MELYSLFSEYQDSLKAIGEQNINFGKQNVSMAKDYYFRRNELVSN